MRRRICDRCGRTIEYSGEPSIYNRTGSHPLPNEPGATIQSAMEVVIIDGEYLDLCVEGGCIGEYNSEYKKHDKDKDKKMKDWAGR